MHIGVRVLIIAEDFRAKLKLCPVGADGVTIAVAVVSVVKLVVLVQVVVEVIVLVIVLLILVL